MRLVSLRSAQAVQKELKSLILLAKISEETVRVVNMESEEGR